MRPSATARRSAPGPVTAVAGGLTCVNLVMIVLRFRWMGPGATTSITCAEHRWGTHGADWAGPGQFEGEGGRTAVSPHWWVPRALHSLLDDTSHKPASAPARAAPGPPWSLVTSQAVCRSRVQARG